MLAREGSHKARKLDEARTSKKPSLECYASQSPSADEIYESSGYYCDNIEEGFLLPLLKKESEVSRKPGIETQKDHDLSEFQFQAFVIP